MIEFNWELTQIPTAIKKGLLEKQIAKFIRPHDAIWGDAADSFVVLAESIYELLPSPHMQRQFLSVCLGSYLLDPRKAPVTVPAWIQKRTSITDLIGIDVSFEELCSWRWDRAAFPVLDENENGKNDTIYYALVASYKTDSYPLCPSWILDVLNVEALDSVKIASELACKSQSDCQFFFWPFINPKKPTHDRSLGLPIYLSFLSLVKEKPIPPIIATGELNRFGELHSIQGVLNKCDKAFEKKFKLFIYPEDGSRLEQQREYKPVGVATLAQAEYEWGVGKSASVSSQRDSSMSIPFVNAPEVLKQQNNVQGGSAENAPSLPTLTETQAEAVNAIIRFINSPTDCFILRGGAGTGKTTLLKVLIHTLMENNRCCMLLAPTGRAARILGNKTEHPACTIHSKIYSFADFEVFEHAVAVNDPGTRLHFELKTDDPGDNIFIVDESSMVADIESEPDDVRFGSGRLLADLMEYTRIGRPGRDPGGSKIIFVGDPCQLPPVKQDISPALSSDYMTKNHGLTCAEFEIRGIVRQKSDSEILEKANCLRDGIEKGVFNTLDLSSSSGEIAKMSSSEAVSLVAESGNKAVLITYSNQQALELNREVRALLWGNENLPVQVSDTLLVNKNAIKHRLFNGDLVKVTKVSENVEEKHVFKNTNTPVYLKFRQIQVAYPSSTGKDVYIDCFILENILDSRERTLSPLVQRALFVDFKIRNSRLKIGTAEFRNALMEDEYFNALQVKYGYAMTCHKAQGGEWDSRTYSPKSHSYTPSTHRIPSSPKRYTNNPKSYSPGGVKRTDDGKIARNMST
ncbi:MAG: AAA family ATPase, partial [Desulfuromonadaceae bacterium]|nr:AAA family ATPase [Desulfuromonadaceae bacterium]